MKHHKTVDDDAKATIQLVLILGNCQKTGLTAPKFGGSTGNWMSKI